MSLMVFIARLQEPEPGNSSGLTAFPVATAFTARRAASNKSAGNDEQHRSPDYRPCRKNGPRLRELPRSHIPDEIARDGEWFPAPLIPLTIQVTHRNNLQIENRIGAGLQQSFDCLARRSDQISEANAAPVVQIQQQL
jgi:hypothetical protein